MSEQLRVTITNLTNRSLSLKWLAKGALCVNPGESLTVDYEPWSCLDSIRRRDMQTYLDSGSISLCMHIMDTNGTQHDIAYNPFSTGSGAQVKETNRKDISHSVTVGQQRHPEIVADKSHIVMTGSTNAGSVSGFTQSPVVPPEQQKREESRQGFNVERAGMAKGVVVDNSNGAYLTANEKKASEEPVKEKDYRTLFNTLVANKKWSEALELLIEEFGADKVTFNARTIMTIKDYDEIVERRIKKD